MLNKCVLLTRTHINASHIYYANGHQLKQECDENLLVISFYCLLVLLGLHYCILSANDCQTVFHNPFKQSLSHLILCYTWKSPKPQPSNVSHVPFTQHSVRVFSYAFLCNIAFASLLSNEIDLSNITINGRKSSQIESKLLYYIPRLCFFFTSANFYLI